MEHPLSSLTILAIIAILFYRLYYLKAVKEKSDKIEKFFMGGRNIGVPFFRETTWSTSFAFGNNIFFSIFLGYTIGLSGIWIQLFWCAGIALYGYLFLPKIIKYSENFTLHGYLGELYGKYARISASVVSIIGLIIATGFEIYFTSAFLSQALGIDSSVSLVIIIILFAVFIATFCSIGGFSANVITDKTSNRFILISVMLILVMFAFKFFKSYSSNFSWDFSVSSDVPSIFYWGIAFIGLYPFIDITNWQTISANSFNNSAKDIKKMQKEMGKASLLIFFFSFTASTIIGYLMKLVITNTSASQDSMVFTEIVSKIFTGTPFDILLLSFISFSFLASSLSAVDSWLLGITQTYSWDIFDYDLFKKYNFDVKNMSDEVHEAVTKKSRLSLLIFGVAGSIFIYLVSLAWADVFALQFVIFGAGVSLLPALIYGLWFYKSGSKVLSIFAFLSIFISFCTSIVVFAVSIFPPRNDFGLYQVPIISIIVSSSVFLIGVIIHHVTLKTK